MSAYNNSVKHGLFSVSQMVLAVLFPEASCISTEQKQLFFKPPRQTATFSLREHFGMNGWFSLHNPLAQWCHSDCQEVTDVGFKCQGKGQEQTDGHQEFTPLLVHIPAAVNLPESVTYS